MPDTPKKHPIEGTLSGEITSKQLPEGILPSEKAPPAKLPTLTASEEELRKYNEALQIAERLAAQHQTKFNTVWEITQAVIAISVTLASMLTSMYLIVKNPESSAAIVMVSSSFSIVIGFYFGRTNHSRPGTNKEAMPPITKSN